MTDLDRYIIGEEPLPAWGTPERRRVRVALLDRWDELAEELESIDAQKEPARADELFNHLWAIDFILYNPREDIENL